MRKYLSKVHKRVGAHPQRVDNHYAKFEHKGMKTLGVTNQEPQKYCRQTDGRTEWTQY